MIVEVLFHEDEIQVKQFISNEVVQDDGYEKIADFGSRDLHHDKIVHNLK